MNKTNPRPGDRYKLRNCVLRFPHFKARAGTVGTITDAFDPKDGVALKMDDHLPGCEEWDNEICWYDADLEHFDRDCVLLKRGTR